MCGESIMNKLELKFNATLENEPVIRNTIALFASTINATLEDLIDIKTIVSEAVSNAIIHGYNNDFSKDVMVSASIDNNLLILSVVDYGKGIKDINEALKISYSSNGRSGLGLTIIKSLSDDMSIQSKENVGTKIVIKKYLSIKNG